MPVKKRLFQQGAIPNSKRQRKTHDDFFQSQDLWKNLDRVRTSYNEAESVMKNSCLFITVFTKSAIAEYKSCLKSLHEYVDAEKLQLIELEADYGFIMLKSFTLLDCCLVLTVLFALKNKRWIAANSSEYFNIPSNVALAGCIYLPENFTGTEKRYQSPISISESHFNSILGFKELSFSASSNISLTSFMDSLSTLFSTIKFGKSTGAIVQRFYKAFRHYQNGLNLGLHENSLPVGVMFDMAKVRRENLPKIENSKLNLKAYAEQVVTFNNQASLKKDVSTKEDTEDTNNVAKQVPNRQQAYSSDHTSASDHLGSSRNLMLASGASHSNSGNNNFMTQDQIKEHCVATIKASTDVLKTKSPYQIFKLYVKCPRQDYVDIIYQNLNDLRSQTNCNIVILNLNNLHESNPWFDSLDVAPYTTFVQRPHPSTVRVISIGGVGEHMIKALDAISKVLSTPLPIVTN